MLLSIRHGDGSLHLPSTNCRLCLGHRKRDLIVCDRGYVAGNGPGIENGRGGKSVPEGLLSEDRHG